MILFFFLYFYILYERKRGHCNSPICTYVLICGIHYMCTYVPYLVVTVSSLVQHACVLIILVDI